jgi:hypothetical protein
MTQSRWKALAGKKPRAGDEPEGGVGREGKKAVFGRRRPLLWSNLRRRGPRHQKTSRPLSRRSQRPCEGAWTLGPQANDGGLPRFAIAGVAKPRKADEHHRPSRGFQYARGKTGSCGAAHIECRQETGRESRSVCLDRYLSGI